MVVAHLLPVWGVWFDHWNASGVFLVYCLESYLIGIFQLLKMGICTWLGAPSQRTEEGPLPAPQTGQGIFLMAFFTLHYGLFMFVQTQLFLGVSGTPEQLGASGNMDLLIHLPQYLDRQSLLLLLVFSMGYLFYLIRDFLLSGQFRKLKASDLMFEPYGRVLVQQVTVILGGFFLALDLGAVFILMFAVIRIVIELMPQAFFRLVESAAQQG